MRALLRPSELVPLLSGVVLLDIQWNLSVSPQSPSGADLYAAAHLPGAVHLDLDVDLADPPGVRGRHPLPDPERLQASLRAVGVDDDSRVVVYDQGPGFGAARAWWVLRWAGLSDVRVLDGGLAAWTLAGGAVTDEVPIVDRVGSVVVRPDSLPTLSASSAADLAQAGVLLDVRAPERFRGEVEPLDPVAGHIPGAVNAPTTSLSAPQGGYLSTEEIIELMAAAGVTPGDGPERVGVYCGSGVTAAHTALALHEIGVSAALYPGSWSEWVTDPSRPVATGA